MLFFPGCEIHYLPDMSTSPNIAATARVAADSSDGITLDLMPCTLLEESICSIPAPMLCVTLFQGTALASTSRLRPLLLISRSACAHRAFHTPSGYYQPKHR